MICVLDADFVNIDNVNSKKELAKVAIAEGIIKK